MSTNIKKNLFDEDHEIPSFEKIRRKPGRKENKPGNTHLSFRSPEDQNFRCTQCNRFVTTQRETCGVNNRNHCPHCLWSRHVDFKTGDRKAQCHSRMQPIGLTLKQTLKKYEISRQGELMLIHECGGCGKISINRIAADDDPMEIQRIFLESQLLENETIERLLAVDIHPLGAGDFALVFSQLFGWQPVLEGMLKEAPIHEIVQVS